MVSWMLQQKADSKSRHLRYNHYHPHMLDEYSRYSIVVHMTYLKVRYEELKDYKSRAVYNPAIAPVAMIAALIAFSHSNLFNNLSNSP